MNGWRRCDGIWRRDFLRVGGLTALGLGVADYLSLIANAEEPARSDGTPQRAFPTADNAAPEAKAAPAAKASRCLLIWLDGGPSHLETFDLKPEAPSEVRGPHRPTSTSVPGIQISGLLPNVAARMQHCALVRSVTSPLGEHNLGAQYVLTGYPPTPALEYPVIGSVAAHLDTLPRPLPRQIAIPNLRVGGQRASGSGYLPRETRPFETGGDPARPDFRVQGFDLFAGLDDSRLNRRQAYLAEIERLSRAGDVADAPKEKHFERAFALLESAEAKAAFDLSMESDETKNRYGRRTIGQSTLLARRLIEAGVPFVTVNNTGWDTHQNLDTSLRAGFTGADPPVGLIPSLDLALSALLDDLSDRGLLDETLVVVMGEFGRTPKLNTQGGRDHWPRVFSVLLAGGGVRGGQVVGSSDATGESPRDRPVTPADIATTIFTLLGIDPKRELRTADGRPIRVATGEPIAELLG